MAKTIKYGVHSSIRDKCKWKYGKPTYAEVGAYIGRGLKWFQHFWDVELVRTPTGSTIFLADDPVKYGNDPSDWVFYAVKYNQIVLNPNKTWTLDSLIAMAAHEMGHKYLTIPHLQTPQYPNGGWDVMYGGAGTHYFGSFGPREIELGFKKGFRLNDRPVHPFCAEFDKNKDEDWKKRNLAKLKSIVLSYGKNHANLYAWQANVNMSEVDFFEEEVSEYFTCCTNENI